MQHRHLKTFLAVAECLNITRAAERVHLAQSSVTEQIQTLEADLGAKLFDREKRRLSLTEAGKRFHAYARELLVLADEARASIAETTAHISGTLKIGGLETLCAAWLPQRLASFRQSHPAIAYDLKVVNSAELRQGVERGALDIGFGFGEPPVGIDLHSEVVHREDLVAIAPPAHRLRSQTMVTTGDLAMEPFLVTAQGCVYRAMFDRTFSAHRPLRPSLVGEFGSLASIRALVAEGVGCAMVPRAVVADGTHEALCLPWSEGAAAVPVYMLWHGRRTATPALASFLDAARLVGRKPLS